MNSSRLSLYIQSIRGPILLMTLGFLCALHQADIMSFRLTWPVLIIVVGVLVLGERLTATPVVTAPLQSRAGGPGFVPGAPPNPFPVQGVPGQGYPLPGGWPNQPTVTPPAVPQHVPQHLPQQGERR